MCLLNDITRQWDRKAQNVLFFQECDCMWYVVGNECFTLLPAVRECKALTMRRVWTVQHLYKWFGLSGLCCPCGMKDILVLAFCKLIHCVAEVIFLWGCAHNAFNLKASSENIRLA